MTRILVAAFTAVIASLAALGYFAYQQQLELERLRGSVAAAATALTELGGTVVRQIEANKAFESKVASEILELKSASQSAIGLSTRVDKVERTFEETRSALSSTTKDMMTQVSVLRVSMQQALSVKLDRSGAVIERAGQKKNGIDLR